MITYMFYIHLTLSFPHCVHKSVLYVCVSITALQIDSSVPFLDSIHMR